MRGLMILSLVAVACNTATIATSPSTSTALATSAPVSAPIDCGSFDRKPNLYDAAGSDCFWDAYIAGRPVRWSIKAYTTEGAPIPESIRFVPGQGFDVTRDLTADAWSGAADRRVWSYRCSSIVRRPWATEPNRYFFELTNCRGDGVETAFGG